MAPEYINNRKISKKFDIFSLGVIVIQIMAGPSGYSTCAEMSSSKKFIEHVRLFICLNIHGHGTLLSLLLVVQACYLCAFWFAFIGTREMEEKVGGNIEIYGIAGGR